MEEVRKRAVLEKDLRQMNEEKARVNEDKAKLNEERSRLSDQQAKLQEEKAQLQEHVQQQKLCGPLNGGRSIAVCGLQMFNLNHCPFSSHA